MIERLETLYDATLRPVGPLHRVLRKLAWAGGDALVPLLSRLRGFELPDDGLFPAYKLQMLLRSYEAATVDVCRALLRPGMTAFDVGAHAGYYTLLFADLVGPQGRVVAFEPHPDTYELLRRNTVRHGAPHVTLIPAAVSDRSGQVPLWETALSMGHSLHPVKPSGRPRAVETVSLDDFCRSRGIDRVDLVKVDVEGAEPEVLDGMRETARGGPPALVLEYKSELCRRRGLPPAAWLDRLRAFGFGTVRLVRGSHTLGDASTADPHALDGVAKCNLVAARPGAL
jgi:FkbM family methyltransferase